MRSNIVNIIGRHRNAGWVTNNSHQAGTVDYPSADAGRVEMEPQVHLRMTQKSPQVAADGVRSNPHAETAAQEGTLRGILGNFLLNTIGYDKHTLKTMHMSLISTRWF